MTDIGWASFSTPEATEIQRTARELDELADAWSAAARLSSASAPALYEEFRRARARFERAITDMHRATLYMRQPSRGDYQSAWNQVFAGIEAVGAVYRQTLGQQPGLQRYGTAQREVNEASRAAMQRFAAAAERVVAAHPQAVQNQRASSSDGWLVLVGVGLAIWVGTQ